MKRVMKKAEFERLVVENKLRVFRGELEVSAGEARPGYEVEYLGRTYTITGVGALIEMED